MRVTFFLLIKLLFITLITLLIYEIVNFVEFYNTKHIMVQQFCRETLVKPFGS